MGSDYEESDDEEFHKALGMKKDAVETLVRRRIEKHKNKILDEDDTELDQNVFNPIDYIISELKAYQAQRGKWSQLNHWFKNFIHFKIYKLNDKHSYHISHHTITFELALAEGFGLKEGSFINTKNNFD